MIKPDNLITILVLLLFATACQNSTTQDNTQLEEPTQNTERTADYNEERNAYFGDLHVHSSWSFDAFIYNTRTTPDDAYKFGKGDAITHALGMKIQLQRPLDFMAVTDHSEYMGIMKQMLDPESPLSQLPLAQQITSDKRAVSLKAFGIVGMSIARNQPIQDLTKADIMRSTWQQAVDIANQHNEPGKFTTFPAYEWTSSPSEQNAPEPFARNLHRNVIFRGHKVSDIPFSSFNSQDPRDLWKWMDQEREKGIDLIAIPHNANMSDGLMYSDKTLDGKPLTAEFAKNSSKNEPVHEVVQIKGQSMAHPALAPNDEFANFEVYPFTFAAGVPPPSKPKHSYVRDALKDGLKYNQTLGENPYKFGLIGSSDGHNSAGAMEENNYFGKLGNLDGLAENRVATEGRFLRLKYMSAAGLAGVWAKENTRDAIYDALLRKEVFASSGPRIKVRFFGGFDLDENLLEDKDWVTTAYEKAVPMGSDLNNSSSNEKAPSFLIWAIKDAESANLDRIQVVKGWVDAAGKTHEKIFDVVWSGDRTIGADGKLPTVGNTVDVKNATYENTIGAVNLKTVWTDPEFDASISAVYYLRVLEIPTPRWTTYDVKKLNQDAIDDVAASIQERAWSSPIWYSPK